MNTRHVTNEALDEAIQRAVNEQPVDELQLRFANLCQGLSEEADDSDTLDREWAQRVYPRVQDWLHRLTVLEIDYQAQVAEFLTKCKASAPGVEELSDEFAQQRIERTCGAVTSYFESVMPDALLTADRAELSISIEPFGARWESEQINLEVNLREVLVHCLEASGELSTESANKVSGLLEQALCDGSAPLPGFRFASRQNGIAHWTWFSSEVEVPDLGDETDLIIEEGIRIVSEESSREDAVIGRGRLRIPATAGKKSARASNPSKAKKKTASAAPRETTR